jgi:Flp pilus assembly protein TadD
VRTDLLIVIALSTVTLMIYAQVIGHPFFFLDDGAYIKGNPMVNGGVTLAGLGWAFTAFHAGNWHPLTWIAHMIDSQLFGMNAGGHLFVNALIHAANTCLLFWVLRRTTHARWRSALVAALFALHPLHVESVAWAAERKDTLSTFFGLLSLITYIRYAEFQTWRRYAVTALMLACGLMSKPMLVSWPFVMLLLDYWPLRRMKGEWSVIRTLVLEKMPFAVIAAASCVVTLFAQSHEGAVRTFTDVSFALRLSNALVSYAKYLLLTFWPRDLAVWYPLPVAGIPAVQVIGSALVLLGITLFCLYQRKVRPYLIVGWLWFLGTLIPVIGLVQVGNQAIADRYCYIPSIGLFIALVFGLADVAKALRIAQPFSIALAGGSLLVLAILTFWEVGRWRDSVTLFEHTLAVTPPNLVIEYNLGHLMSEQGRYDEAAAHFAKAIEIKPDFYEGLFNMGIMQARQARVAEAVVYYQRAIRVRPSSARAHMELGMALAKQSRNDMAEAELRQAAELAPKDAEIRSDLGIVLAQLGRISEAIDQYHEAIRLEPESVNAHINLGLALLASGRARESIPEFEAALRLKPDLQIAADSLRRAQAELK